MIKVLIADDQELIRESLKIVLGANEDMEVTGIAENGEQVLSEIKKEKPNVILMDIRMPGIDGVECTRLVKEKYPDIYIIVLTTFDDDEYIWSVKVWSKWLSLKRNFHEESCGGNSDSCEWKGND